MPIKAIEPSPQTNLRTDLESDLALGMLRVVEAAAIAAAHTMGQGDRRIADQVATETMRNEMESVPMQGTIVIG
jgi:fructose-1,6-bisphosphatase/sedoheptulose 1,7-bisphosphatase-like protein